MAIKMNYLSFLKKAYLKYCYNNAKGDSDNGTY